MPRFAGGQGADACIPRRTGCPAPLSRRAPLWARVLSALRILPVIGAVLCVGSVVAALGCGRSTSQSAVAGAGSSDQAERQDAL